MFTQMTRLFHKIVVLQIIKAPSHNLTIPSFEAFGPFRLISRTSLASPKNINETGPADEFKWTKRVQGWSCQIMGSLLLFAMLLFCKKSRHLREHAFKAHRSPL